MVNRGKPRNELTEIDHEEDFEIVCNYKLLLIDVGSTENMNANALLWLEKVLTKAYKVMDGAHLLNTRVGGPEEHYWEVAVDKLIR